MKLERYEIEQPVIQKLIRYFNEELSDLRQSNDGAGLTETQTALIRGEIRRIKKTIDLFTLQPSSK